MIPTNVTDFGGVSATRINRRLSIRTACLWMLRFGLFRSFLSFLRGIVVGVSADRQSAGDECGAPFSACFIHLRLEEKKA